MRKATLYRRSRTRRASRIFLLVSVIATTMAFLAPSAQAATVLTVDKTAAPAEGGSVPAGGTITYSILVTNSGVESADNVTITDATPANTTYVDGSATVNGGPPIAGGNPFAAGLNVGSITGPGTATATFQVTVNSPLANGTTITNTASVTGDNVDDPGSDLSDDAVHTVASSPTLQVTKTSAPPEGDPVSPGDPITYTVVVENVGSDVATGVTLTDPTPANTTYTPGSATISDGTAIPDPATNPFQNGLAIADIPAAGTTTASFAVTVNSPAANATPIENTATATATGTGPASDDADHTVASTPGLTVDKTADPAEGGPVSPGDTITYTIVVANDVLATANGTGLILTDDAPTGTTYVAGSATISDGTAIPDPATNPFATPGLSIDDLTPGESTTATFQVTVDNPQDDGTELVNTATLANDQGADVTDEATHTVESQSTLSMVKSANPAAGGPVTAGTNITYTLAVTNDEAANEVAHGMVLTDPTPQNTTYVEGSAKLGETAIEGSGNPLAGGYELPDLAPGETATVTYEVKVNSPLAKGMVISNLASLSAENHPDVTAEASHTVDSSAVMKVEVTSTPAPGAEVKTGQTITYTLKVANDAAASASLTNVKVTESAPKGTTYEPESTKLDTTPSDQPSTTPPPSTSGGGMQMPSWAATTLMNARGELVYAQAPPEGVSNYTYWWHNPNTNRMEQVTGPSDPMTDSRTARGGVEGNTGFLTENAIAHSLNDGLNPLATLGAPVMLDTPPLSFIPMGGNMAVPEWLFRLTTAQLEAAKLAYPTYAYIFENAINDPHLGMPQFGGPVSDPSAGGSASTSSAASNDTMARSAASSSTAAAAPGELLLGNIAPGESRTVSLSITVNRSASGELTNTATVSADNHPSVVSSISHTADSDGSNRDRDGDGGGGGGGNDGIALGLGGTTAVDGELAFTGLDLARLVLLAVSLLLAGSVMLSRGSVLQRRETARQPVYEPPTGPFTPSTWFFTPGSTPRRE